MSALKPYPHYEINVKDNSIYTFAIEEILPVHRPLWILRTQEGPVGEPVWCSNASKLMKIFGTETLNMANKKYASPQTFFLRNTMTYDGAFIVRALGESAKCATAVLIAEVTENADIVQYEKDTDPTSASYGSRKVDLAEKIVIYSLTSDIALNPEKDYYVQEDGVYKKVTKPELKAIGTYYEQSISNNPNYGEYIFATVQGAADGMETDLNRQGTGKSTLKYKTAKGIKIRFKVRPATDDEIKKGLDRLTVVGSDNVKQYPIMVFKATNPGDYGNDLAFRLFYKESENSSFSLAKYKAVFNSLSAVRREYNNSTTNVVCDVYGRNFVSFASDADAIDPETAVQLGMDSVVTNAFDVENAEGTNFPYTVYTYETNLKIIGDQIIAAEKTAEDGGQMSLAFDEFGCNSAEEMSGYQVNVLSGSNIKGVPYDRVAIVGRKSYTVTASNGVDDQIAEDMLKPGDVLLDQLTDIFLSDGSDGADLADASELDRDDFVDHFTQQFLTLKINPQIVDKFHYPFTHLYDPGYSMTTKYAMIDFLDTRDDVAVELSTQVLFPNGWSTGLPNEVPGLNDQAKDIANGLVLRSRALLMRESILKGTECMRCSIYTQSGKPIAVDYNKPVPFTLWSAMQHAHYGNTDQMSATEPRGLPYSYNEMFSSWNWTNYSEFLKEKTWDAGLNYCQYADMTRIFYPALRTVYRAETSVLNDQWVVDALVYTKHECRKAWARFSGRNDRQAELEAAIKNYLEEKLSYLYNGKYDFTLAVYKTDEEQKLGYIEHVKLKLVFPATMRVLNFDIEVNREGFENESEA